MSEKCDIGLVGLAVMGQNLVLNMESKGFTVAVFNRTTETTEKFLSANSGRKLVGAKTLEEFVASLARPRRIMIMVKAGAPVDAVIDSLLPLLEPGDRIERDQPPPLQHGHAIADLLHFAQDVRRKEHRRPA
ncbi:MAG: NAD(P)-binding domain-containing protein, partial [Verrucomicrobiia bacterium]